MRIKNILSILVVSLILMSCMFTEELYLKNDSSGSYNFKIDMSEMMESVKDMSTRDSLKEPEVLDTLIVFNDLLESKKDSIATLSLEEQASLEAIRDLKLRMQINEEEGTMFLDFGLDFKDISELKNMEEKIAKAQALNSKKEKNDNMNFKSNANYTFKGNTFKRKAAPKQLSAEEEEDIDASMKQAETFLEGSTYTLVYHFEKEIKSISIKGATLSNDRKTMTLSVPMDSIIKNPTLLDFEVKLKK